MKTKLWNRLLKEFGSKYEIKYDKKRDEWRIYTSYKTFYSHKTKEGAEYEIRNLWHNYLERYIWCQRSDRRAEKIKKSLGYK